MKIKRIDKELSQILEQMLASEGMMNRKTKDVHVDLRHSAENLFRYLMIRSIDLRKYHDTLSDLGLSSLRSSEGYVLNNIYKVVRNLRLIQGKEFNIQEPDHIGYNKSKKILRKNSRKLFKSNKGKKFTDIMVTLPNEAADDDNIIKDMALNGMQIARINLSHGDLDIWKRMIKIIKNVEKETKRKITIYIDLPGPKIRTAKIEITNKKGKVKNKIPVQRGERIIVTKRETSGKKSKFDDSGVQIEKAVIGVQLHQIVDDVQIGDPVLFDDGMIRSKVVAKTDEAFEIEITDCFKSKIGSHKGINLPETKLGLPALTETDIKNLPFVCKNADVVGYSFVRTGEDVEKLYAELDKNKANDIGVVFKIENKEAFGNLPEILFRGMKRKKIGVMIARGDLAVEIGFERISEVQNEILWICEAAHVPVIWATQVLENLAKTGIPTRAEISDAAQAVRAECVMLNKGEYINDAIRVLKDILIRMEGHSFKKKNELRALKIAKLYLRKLKISEVDQSNLMLNVAYPKKIAS